MVETAGHGRRERKSVAAELIAVPPFGKGLTTTAFLSQAE